MLPTVPDLQDYISLRRDTLTLRGRRNMHTSAFQRHPQLATIITAVRNGKRTLPRTIESVTSQSYPHLEYIVVDGASTDGTPELLRQYENSIDVWISEPDTGISDAFNKGIALASGEFIALVNADDWLEPNHIAQSVHCLQHSNADFTFGDLLIHDFNGTPQYSIIGDEQYYRRLHHEMPTINHPSMVCRRRLYETNGLYDPSYKIAMDYEWLLRNHARGAKGKYIPNLISHMGAAGISQRQVRTSLREVRRASVAYGYPKTAATTKYLARLTKARLRRTLELIFPRTIVDLLHTFVNPHYKT